jgi:hypothetical protein
VHSSRTERTKRSACGLQLGLRGGALTTLMSSLAKAASGTVNVASRSRIRNRNWLAVADHPQQLSGLLGGPRGGGVGGDAEDVHPAGAV